MKQGKNNEIDLLLRDLARRAPSLTAAEGGGIPGAGDQLAAHLDTDELNSYVEGVLPDAARARYTAHLADCARCRDIVARLTPLTAASIHKPEAQQESSDSWWQKLAAFLSLPVLRYAMPALVLCAVLALGLMVLRQQRREEFVAQNEPTTARAPAAQSERERLLDSNTEAGESSGFTSSKAEQTRIEPKPGPAQPGKSEGENDKTSATNEKASSDARLKKDMPQSLTAGAVAQPSYAPEPAAPPAPPKAVADEVGKYKEEEKLRAASGQAANDATARRQREGDDESRNRSEGRETQAGARKTESASVAGRTLSIQEGTVPGAGGAKRVDNKTETRTVAGHHFRRQGNVWVDTSYESPRTVIDVKRGSEQYRDLVADEPGLRSIAEQLKGEVIVVWEDRAYRIH